MNAFEKAAGALKGNRAREVGPSDYGAAQQRIEVNKRKAALGSAAKRMTDKALSHGRAGGWGKFTNSLFDTKAIAAASGGGMLRK